MKRLSQYKNIILASKSPRRLEILRAHGIKPTVLPTSAEEILEPRLNMVQAVKALASLKAHACYDVLSISMRDDSLILASDTIVYTDKLGIMGKPADHDDAFLMLDTIRNTSHYVATGVSMIDALTGEERTIADVTEVFCKDYSIEDIEHYIDEDSPYDKAGSYAIQSSFGQYVDHIVGSYENVVGLPFDRIVTEIGK